MRYPRCKQCQKLLYTKEEIFQNLCSACAQKSLSSSIHPFCHFPPHYYCAWEDKSLFFYRRFWMTWGKIIFHPADFFDHLPRIPDKISPLSFAYLSYAHFFLFLFMMVSFGNLLPSLPELMMGTLGLILITSSWLILVPATLYFSAFIFHLGIVLQLKKRKFHQTVRVIGYANAIQVLQTLPIINLIAGVWYLIIIVKGLKRVHQLSTGQAILTIIFIPLLFIILTAIILATIFTSFLV